VIGLDRLLELQDLDLSIGRLNSRREQLEGGEDVRAARERMQAAEERVGELRLALDSVVRELTKLEHDADSLDKRIEAERKRLYDGSVANPKELEAIQAEIRNLTDRKRRVEDLELDQMERREEMEGKLPALEAELAETRDRLAEISAGSETELADIAKGLAERQAERAELAGGFDEELLELYEDLRRTKRGIGAAALVDGVCQGCHQKLSAVELDRIKRSEGVRRCEYCRRILVLS
jgi:predicted  nucleic acid-binding Zn-ribbon protein